MTTTETEAFEAMLAHHASLTDGVEHRFAALRSAVAAGAPYQARVADLVAYIADEVLPHALAEERTIYPAAARRPDLATTVDDMTSEHRQLTRLSEELARATHPEAALEAAGTLAPLFASHVDKENDVLLPRLAADGALAGLLGDMHGALEAARSDDGAGAVGPGADAVGPVLALLLEATRALAAVGEGDRACRLAASAWVALREPRPDLAARVAATLHGLARSANSELVQFTPRPGATSTEEVLDVRELAPAQRHRVIFASYARLAPGLGFVLVNDHDPKPLQYQFEAEHSGHYTWHYLETGPRVWRVRIGRPETAGASR
jgi:uncharacterized protein (DUF2249 family)